MRGIWLKKAGIIAEDDRRKIVSVLNGEIGVRDIHILTMKKGGQILGNHSHFYPEVMYVIKGKVTYWLKHQITGETEVLEMSEGDIMFRAPYVVHTCECSEDAILLDGAAESWVGEEWNHIREVLK